jgi:hypothetical protein
MTHYLISNEEQRPKCIPCNSFSKPQLSNYKIYMCYWAMVILKNVLILPLLTAKMNGRAFEHIVNLVLSHNETHCMYVCICTA